jgi:hypothetical protein
MASEGDSSVFLRTTRKAAVDAVAQAEWAAKKWVWIFDKTEGHLAAHIVAEKGDEITVKLADESVCTCPSRLPPFLSLPVRISLLASISCSLRYAVALRCRFFCAAFRTAPDPPFFEPPWLSRFPASP